MAARKQTRKVPRSVARKLADAQWLRGRYVDDRMSTTAIAALLGVSARTVTIWLDKAGIARRGRGSHVRDPAVIARLASDGERLRRRYVDEGRSIHWIAGEFHVDHRAVADALRARGIPIRLNPSRGTAPAAE